MKKLYTVALAAACVLGVSAAPQLKQIERTAPFKTASTVKMVKKNHAAAEGLRKALALQADEAQDIAGEYDIYIGDYYFQTSIGDYSEEAVITHDGNTITIKAPSFYAPVTANFNEATGEITFNQQSLEPITVQGQTYYPVFAPTHWIQLSETEGDIQWGTYSVQYDAATSSITWETDYGFGWYAFADQAMNEGAGYLAIFDIIGMLRYTEDEDPHEGWVSLGNATFLDGYICSAFTNGIGSTWEVELQMNEDDHHIYRLVDPYHAEGFPYLDYNTVYRKGYIQFNVSNPDQVVFDAVPAGFGNTSLLGLANVYCMNELTMYMGYLGVSAEDAVELILGQGMELNFTSFKDGVLTVPSADACFGVPDKVYDGYFWADSNGVRADMTTVITFPEGWYEAGVESVAVSNNAPVEFFNLQGIRVQNPAAGQLVIRRQGNETSKYIVR